MKKVFPIILAAIIFVVAWVMLRPAPSRAVVVAASICAPVMYLRIATSP